MVPTLGYVTRRFFIKTTSPSGNCSHGRKILQVHLEELSDSKFQLGCVLKGLRLCFGSEELSFSHGMDRFYDQLNEMKHAKNWKNICLWDGFENIQLTEIKQQKL